MPELPDVQVFKEYVDATSLHQQVTSLSVRAPELLSEVSERSLRRHLLGRPFTRSRRHGKHLFVKSGDGDRWLRLHFGMTGDLDYAHDPDDPEHTRLRIDFAGGGRLAYLNPRKLGEVGLVRDVDRFVADRDLGPDPLLAGLGAAELRERLEGRRGSIKSTLMNQEVLAGLGNVYVDEILFHAGVDPHTPAKRLTDAAHRGIHHAMERVIAQAIAARARPRDMPRGYLLPRREAGTACPRRGCAGKIEKDEISGRATYWCPEHQRSDR